MVVVVGLVSNVRMTEKAMMMGAGSLVVGGVKGVRRRLWFGPVEDVLGPMAASDGAASCVWRWIRGRGE